MNDILEGFPSLEPGTVHIIHFSEEAPARYRSKFLGFLTREDNQEFDTCISMGEKARRQLYRGMLRAVLGGYCSAPPAALRFSTNSHGKPFLNPDCCSQPLQFNLSHSGTRGVMAVAIERQVGIDIEKIARRSYVEEIAARFFTAEEREYLYADEYSENRLERFYFLWTRKEAVVKAMGESLPRWLIEIAVLPSDPPETWKAVQTASLPDGALISFDAGPGYAGALCVETRPGRIETITLEALGGLPQ